jgi:hypothetical protein
MPAAVRQSASPQSMAAINFRPRLEFQQSCRVAGSASTQARQDRPANGVIEMRLTLAAPHSDASVPDFRKDHAFIKHRARDIDWRTS